MQSVHQGFITENDFKTCKGVLEMWSRIGVEPSFLKDSSVSNHDDQIQHEDEDQKLRNRTMNRKSKQEWEAETYWEINGASATHQRWSVDSRFKNMKCWLHYTDDRIWIGDILLY